MSEQQTFFSRLGSWFRKGREDELPLSDSMVIEPRSTFLRPWAKRDAAMQNLRDGFMTLTDLMASIRQTLEHQTKRQDELLTYLSHLPEVMRSIPESNRAHGETLKAIHLQIEQQHIQQEKLAEILEKLSTTGGQQQENIEQIRERIDSIRETDEAISSNLSSLGSALQSVSRNSSASTEVLTQLRDRQEQRDGQLEKILHKQNVRFTTMLAIAIFLSIAALVAVSVIGYLLLQKK